MKRIGIVTMNLGDRESLSDVIQRLGDDIEVHVAGIIDPANWTRYKRGGSQCVGQESFIVSKIQDCTIAIPLAEATRLVKNKIRELEVKGIRNVLVFCTGNFELAGSQGFVVLPKDVITGLLKGLDVKKLGAIVPDEKQVDDCREQYREFETSIRVFSPYGSEADLRVVAGQFGSDGVDLVLMDCMGYTQDMGQLVREVSGKKVVVPRVFVPFMMRYLVQ